MARGKIGDWLTEDSLQKIESWARRGLTNEQIASNIGINPCTLSRWIKRESQINQSLKKGRAVVLYQLENALTKKAMGYTEKNAEVERRITFDKDGNKHVETIERDKTYPPDTGANIFLTKNWNRGSYQNNPKTPDEIEAIRLQNEHTRLKNELLRRMLNDENLSVLKIDELIGEIDVKAIEDAE